MADTTSQDQAAKARIVKHMNEDHHDSVVRYLQHYNKLSSFNAYDGKLQDIDLGSLTLACQGQTYRLPLDPPMKSYREARERVVELDKDCRKALGQSDVAVKEFVPPKGLQAIIFTVIVATFIAYSQRWWFAKGEIVERLVGPAFARFSWKIQPYLLSFLLVAHGVETVYLAAVKLKHHSVNIRSSTFWKWTASTLIEGQFAYRRFDAHVKTQREKQRH